MNSRYPRRRRLFFPLIVLLAFLALSGVVYGLWNAVLVEVVPVKTVTYVQAMGLLLLSRILLGGFRFGPPRGGPSGFGREKWRNMTDEERAKFRDEWKRRWGRS